MKPCVLMVSKPITPPWNDSSKNLVKDLTETGVRFRYRVLSPRGYSHPAEGVISEPLYSGVGAYTPPLFQNAKVLLRLLRSDETVLTHFFYAPNPKTSFAARAALLLRQRRTIQTVCSIPANFDTAAKLLFAERVIVLSRHTHEAFVATGISPHRLCLIPPGIQIPTLPRGEERRLARKQLGLPPDRPVIIYPGDYQFSGAADTFARAIAQIEDLSATFIFACRIKQPASREIESRIRSRLHQAGKLAQVRMFNEVEDMRQLLTACDLCVLPAESLFAKMDLPLVLIEAMSLGIPLVLARTPPLSELLTGEIGRAVPPGDADALAAAIKDLLADRPLLERLGENARGQACANYDIKRISKIHEDLYQDLLEG